MVFSPYLLALFFPYCYSTISYIDYYKDKESYKNFNNLINRFDLLFINIYIVIPASLAILFNYYPIINNYDSVYRELKIFIINIVFGEFWFYILHRLNHTKILYKLIHKTHHKDYNPVGILAFYSNPIECLFVNVFSSYLVHYWYTLSLYQYTLFTTFVLANTIFYSHSSNSYENTTHHIHHKLLNYNYGFSIFMDKLCGTEKLSQD